MALGAAVFLAPFLLEDEDFVGAGLFEHLGHDLGARDQRIAHGGVGALADHENLVELNGRASLARELLDRNDIVLGDLILLAAGADDCVHRVSWDVPRETRRLARPRRGEGLSSRLMMRRALYPRDASCQRIKAEAREAPWSAARRRPGCGREGNSLVSAPHEKGVFPGARSRGRASIGNEYGWVLEWLNRLVSKTSVGASPPWVRIPPQPPHLSGLNHTVIMAIRKHGILCVVSAG